MSNIDLENNLTHITLLFHEDSEYYAELIAELDKGLLDE
jgi:hypothetical protein